MNQSLNDAQVFFYAVRKNNLKVVQQCISVGFNIDAKDAEGKTALHYACDRGYTPIVKLLLQYRVNLRTTDEAGRTPLHYACFSGHADIIQLLLQNGVPVNAQCQSGFTASHTASANGMMDSILLLCKYGADLSVKDSEMVTPLHLAMQRYKNTHDFEGAKMFCFLKWLRYPKARDKKGRLPLHRALLNVDFTWKNGIELIVHGHPDAVAECHTSLRLPPFALAAVRRKNNTRKHRDLTSIYELLLQAPHLVPSSHHHDKTQHHESTIIKKLDAKSALQNWAVRKGLPLPKYKIIRKRGRHHDPIFTSRVKVKGIPFSMANGKSKKEAETRAASKILIREGIGNYGVLTKAKWRDITADRFLFCFIKTIKLKTILCGQRKFNKIKKSFRSSMNSSYVLNHRYNV